MLHSVRGLAREQLYHQGNQLPRSFFCLLSIKTYLYIYLDTESHNAAQAGLELKIFLPQLSKCTTMT